jgi:hypothetical protein
MGIKRPAATGSKIGFKNQFELCYLRHKYLRKSEHDLTKEEIKVFSYTVKTLTLNTFNAYRGLFGTVGLEYEDLVSIAYVHLTSFLGLFSIFSNEDVKQRFTERFQKEQTANPKELDFFKKEKANFASFLNQRMEELVRICKQKSRNIGTANYSDTSFFKSPDKIELNEEIANNYKKHNLSKIDLMSFRSIRNQANPKNKRCFLFENNWYYSISLAKKTISYYDFDSIKDDYHDNIHCMTPEQAFAMKEEEQNLKLYKDTFDGYSKKKQKHILRTFIKTHEKSPYYKKEVKKAKRRVNI